MAEETQDQRLSPGAKEAVRSYILSLMIAPSIVIAIVSGITGFFIKNILYQTAYYDVYGKMADTFNDLAKRVQSNFAESEAAKINAKTSEQTIKQIVDQRQVEIGKWLDEVQKQVRQAQHQSEQIRFISDQKAEEIARFVVTNDAFREAATKIISPELAGLRASAVTLISRNKEIDDEITALRAATKIVIVPKKDPCPSSDYKRVGAWIVGIDGSIANEWNDMLEVADYPSLIRLSPTVSPGWAVAHPYICVRRN